MQNPQERETREQTVARLTDQLMTQDNQGQLDALTLLRQKDEALMLEVMSALMERYRAAREAAESGQQ